MQVVVEARTLAHIKGLLGKATLGLNDVILHSHHDAIVVGSGLGRLRADSLLAKRGLTVLIIDQQNV